ncbi:hypothetical protein BJ912DRAFT_1141282 [Pholiota molesta]|nr:hypothetical protein BJ912DRAFT_1141282 [Pholiota molesta]
MQFFTMSLAVFLAFASQALASPTPQDTTTVYHCGGTLVRHSEDKFILWTNHSVSYLLDTSRNRHAPQDGAAVVPFRWTLAERATKEPLVFALFEFGREWIESENVSHKYLTKVPVQSYFVS